MKIDVSLDTYKIFCSVVKNGSMSEAAKELFLSQPAVSMSIKMLEEKLGNPLFLRSSKGVKATSEGYMLYSYLTQALGLIDTAEKKYLEMVNLEAGEIRIGASDTIMSQYLMPYIEKFINKYNKINIKITNRTTYETIKLLKNGQADIGFINLPIEKDDSLEIFNVLEINDCLVGGSKYKYLAEKGISVSDICNYPLLLLEKASNTRVYLDYCSKLNGVTLKPNIELGSTDLLVKFAKINIGLTFVIKEFSTNDIDNQSIFRIPLENEFPKRHIGFIKLKDVGLSYAATEFKKLFQI